MAAKDRRPIRAAAERIWPGSRKRRVGKVGCVPRPGIGERKADLVARGPRRQRESPARRGSDRNTP